MSVYIAEVKVRKFALVLLVCLIGCSVKVGLVAPQLGDRATELCPFKFFDSQFRLLGGDGCTILYY